MSTPESPGTDSRSAEASQDAAPAPRLLPVVLLPSPEAPLPDDEIRHVHHVVSVRVEETPDATLYLRTEAILEHRHGPPSDESDDRPVPRPRPRRLPPPGRREGFAGVGLDPGGHGAFISFGSKSRLPTQMARTQLIAYLDQERRLALDVRDPVAISVAAERYNTITAYLQEGPDGEIIDLLRPILSVSQAAKILGYNAKEVRRLLGQGKINGRKVGSEWRIPLRAVL